MKRYQPIFKEGIYNTIEKVVGYGYRKDIKLLK